MILPQRCPVVEHRMYQHLRPQRDALVMAALRDGGREAATGARVNYGDAVGTGLRRSAATAAKASRMAMRRRTANAASARHAISAIRFTPEA
jgi:hypothetical protein